MANNVAATPGTGVTFKTTDNAGVHTGHVNVDSNALPTGAATAAKQPALGTAGSASTDVITVQGIASGTALTVASHAVTNAGTFVIQENGAALTALQLIDDVVYTDDTSTHSTGASKGALMMAAATPTDAAVDANDIGALAMTLARELKVSVTTAVPAGNNNIGDVDVLTVPTDPFGANADAASATGSISAKLKGVATALGVTALDLGSGTSGSRTLRTMIDTSQVDSVAHDAVDSGTPAKIGGQARTTNPTAVADADRTNFIADKLGKQVVVGSIRELKGVQQTALSNTTSETTIVTAVASTFLDLYGLILANTGATATSVTIKDDTAGTTRAIVYVPAGDTRGFMLNESAAIPQAVVNKPWTATCSAATTAMQVTALFVKNI